MEVYNKIIDDRSEYFFGSIPRWITHYAFMAMVVLFVGLFIASYFVTVPDRKQVQVILSGNAVLVKLDYSTFNNVKFDQQVNIELPIYGSLEAKLDIASAYLSGENIFCNAKLNRKLDINRIKGIIHCRGEILMSNTSILKKIFSN